MISPPASGIGLEIVAQIYVAAWGRRQTLVILLIASAIIFDGFEHRMPGFVVPALIGRCGPAGSGA